MIALKNGYLKGMIAGAVAGFADGVILTLSVYLWNNRTFTNGSWPIYYHAGVHKIKTGFARF